MVIKKKPLLIIATLLIVTVGSIVLARYFFGKEQFGRISIDTLSQRAKDFIDEQRKQSGSKWSIVNVEASPDQSSKEISEKVVTPCFTIDLPTQIRYQKTPEDSPCTLKARLISPGARLTISVVPLKTSLKENASIHMRQTLPDQYIPQKVQIDRWQNTLIFLEEDGVSFFAQKDDELITVVFSETQSQDIILEKLLTEVVEKIVIVPKGQRGVGVGL